MQRPFPDRVAAGRALTSALPYAITHKSDILVLALPRGGVPVAAEVAKALDAELDLLIVRKLGLPWHPEYAMGAIASGGVRVLNEDVILNRDVSDSQLQAVVQQEEDELVRRDQAYRAGRPHPRIKGRSVILVDDGIATGSTMQAAVKAVRMQQPDEIIVAVPVAPPDSLESLRKLADSVVCVMAPRDFYAVGQWYQNFNQVTDDEVRELLAVAWSQHKPTLAEH